MTVAVACNLSDGVILGVDSAVTLPGPGQDVRIYENAEKLFQLGKCPLGVAIYGLGAIGSRTIGSYLREFEVRDPGGVLAGQAPIHEVVEALRRFLLDEYYRIIVPALEAAAGMPFTEIPKEQWPVLGLVLGGFSPGAYLSEVWEILVPVHDAPNSAIQRRGQGSFGVDWFAAYGPLLRYIVGIDGRLLEEIVAYFQTLLGRPLSQGEEQDLTARIAQYHYRVPFEAMPIQDGIEYTRFLIDLVINTYRFSGGARYVGGRAKLGRVTYRDGQFELLPG